MGESITKYQQYTDDEIRLLRLNKIIPAECPAEQIAFFTEVCRRKRLDPFQKQIHLIERNENTPAGWRKSYTIQAGIDGMRAIAQRNGKIAGIERGVRYDDRNRLYGWCRIKMTAGGEYYDELAYDEYVQKTKQGEPNAFWRRMPETMIKKCAEESVLRMCAPEDLSGVYGDDEMMQADSGESIPPLLKNTDEKPALIPAEIGASIPIESAPSAEEIKAQLKKPYEKKPVSGEKPFEVSIPMIDNDAVIDGKTVREWVLKYSGRKVFEDYATDLKSSIIGIPFRDCDPLKLEAVWKKIQGKPEHTELALRIQAFLTSNGLPF